MTVRHLIELYRGVVIKKPLWEVRVMSSARVAGKPDECTSKSREIFGCSCEAPALPAERSPPCGAGGVPGTEAERPLDSHLAKVGLAGSVSQASAIFGVP